MLEFDSKVYLLSSRFANDYPLSLYPELMYKQGRPYTCLLIETHDDYFICVPFRSSINHKNAFLFKGTARSLKSHSGLDYSKTVIIRDSEYIDSTTPAIVDQDEYREMSKNIRILQIWFVFITIKSCNWLICNFSPVDSLVNRRNSTCIHLFIIF